MIKPSIGRVVWFTPSKSDPSLTGSDQPLAAIITYVHSDVMVNLAVFDANGSVAPRTSAYLVPDDEVPEIYRENGYYAEWMPFQKGQAAKQGGPRREARELALKHCAPELYGNVDEHLQAVAAVAHYIETGEMPAKQCGAA